MSAPAPHLTLVVASPIAPLAAESSSSPADPNGLSLGVVLLLDVLVRIEQRRQARLRALCTKAAS